MKGSAKDRLRALFSDPESLPAASRLFGFELIDLDPDQRWVAARFFARDEFLNPNGTVQGGIVTGFSGPAGSARRQGEEVQPVDVGEGR